MATCNINGNADMYGLGVRLGFYITWYGSIFASWIAPTEFSSVAFTLDLFVAATFLALIIETARNDIQPVETYIILLLMFGSYLYLVPLWFWRLITGFRAEYDPSRLPRVATGRVRSDLRTLLVLGVVAFQLWFWLARVPDVVPDLGCYEWGFLFTKIWLDSTALRVVNLVFNFLLGVILLVMLSLRIRDIFSPSLDQPQLVKIPLERQTTLQVLDTMNRLIVLSTIVVATELTIHWNHIGGVYSLTSAGQTIPFVIALGTVLRVAYVWAWSVEDGSDHVVQDPVIMTQAKPQYARYESVSRMPLHSARYEPVSRMPQVFKLRAQQYQTRRTRSVDRRGQYGSRSRSRRSHSRG